VRPGILRNLKPKSLEVSFDNIDGSSRQEGIKRLKVGQKIRLAWGKNNPHDPNAVLLFPGGTDKVNMKNCIGHLNASLAADVVNWATINDWYIYAEVAEILGGTDECETLGCLLEITVYKENNE
jgi:hypothetical protein